MPLYNFTNARGTGPRGVNRVSGGIALVQAGQTRTLEVTEDELVGMDAIFDIEPVEAADPLDHDGDGKKGGVKLTDAADDDSATTALGLLDPDRDEDWTSAGLPAVEAVAALAGGKVTRAQIEALAPDLTRETAPKA